MKTIEINLYKFSELSETAKQKAIEKLYDINVDNDWWEFIFDDAKNIGLKITSFDLYSGKADIDGELFDSACDVCFKIKENHGEKTDTYKLACDTLNNWDKLVEKYSDGKDKTKVSENNEHEFDSEADYLENEFKKELLEEYLSILQKEYDYMTSEKAIIESIEANEYDFTENGEIY